jgi:hypothetical protein
MIRKIVSYITLVTLFVSLLLSDKTSHTVKASSHREGPLIKLDPTADNTDVYAFRSTEAGRSGFVTLIANFIPFEEPAGGPHFYRFDDNAIYKIKIDNSGDGIEDITYEFRFTSTIVNPNIVLGQAAPNQALAGQGAIDPLITSLTDPDYNEPQTYTVTRVSKASSIQIFPGPKGTPGIVPPDNIGPRTTPNYEAALAQPAIVTLPNGGRVFAGQRDEGFYIDVESIFDTLNLASLGATGGTDSTAGFNVHSVALEVPISDLTRDGSTPTNPVTPNAVIGVWSTVDRLVLPRKSNVPPVQVSRLASPLVNELVIPLGLKDTFNGSQPFADLQFAQFVADPQLPKLIQAVLASGGITIGIPPAPRNDLVAIFATGIPASAIPGFSTFLSDGVPHEYLRLNVAIPPAAEANRSRLGLLGGDIAGYPNGRRVGDDVTDISLRAVLGGTPFTPAFNIAPNNTVGDGVDRNDVPFLDRFPYLATPHAGNGAGNAAGHLHHVQR